MGSVAAGEDGARLGKGGGFADLEFALASAAGLIGPQTVAVTTVHEVQVRPAGVIPRTATMSWWTSSSPRNGSLTAARAAARGRPPASGGKT